MKRVLYVPVTGRGRKPKLRRLSYSGVEREVVKQLRGTLKPAKAIAKDFGIPRSMVTTINRRHGCRSRYISYLVGQRLGLKWRELPKRNLLSVEHKNRIIKQNLRFIRNFAGKYREWGTKQDREDLMQQATLMAFEALDHYDPALCSERVFVLLVTRKVIRATGYDIRLQKKLFSSLDEFPLLESHATGKEKPHI